MKQHLYDTGTSRTVYSRDDSSKQATIHTREFVDPFIKQAAKIRNERLMESGKKMPLVEGGENVFSFSMPPVEFSLMQKKYPDVYAGLISKNIEDNIKAGQQLALLYPQFCLNASPKA